jgi:hypothetical protein
MNFTEALPVAGPAITAIGLAGGLARWVFAVSAKANEAMEAIQDIKSQSALEKAAQNKRLEKVEETTMSIRDLTFAVRHQGELTAVQLKALTDKISEHSDYTRDRFMELRAAQVNLDQQLQIISRQTK